MGDKIIELIRKLFTVASIEVIIGGIVLWFGVIPLMATVFQSIFTGLEFLIIMGLMIALIILIAKIVWNIEF